MLVYLQLHSSAIQQTREYLESIMLFEFQMWIRSIQALKADSARLSRAGLQLQSVD